MQHGLIQHSDVLGEVVHEHASGVDVEECHWSVEDLLEHLSVRVYGGGSESQQSDHGVDDTNSQEEEGG